MSKTVKLRHVMRYSYPQPTHLGPQIVRLQLAPHCRARVLNYALNVMPSSHSLHWQQDPSGNWLARFVFGQATDYLNVQVDLTAELLPVNPFDFLIDVSAISWPFTYSDELRGELVGYLATDLAGPLVAAYLSGIPKTAPFTINFLVELNQRLSQRIQYTQRMEEGIQTPEETLSLNSGSCRDSGALLVQILRHLGLAARFVSGYLIELRLDNLATSDPSITGRDNAALHAWAEVYLPGAGWIGLDPSSGVLCAESHLPLAATIHPLAAAPLSGTAEFASSDFSYEMIVSRV